MITLLGGWGGEGGRGGGGERGKWLFCFSLVCGLYTVCHGLFALPLDVIGRLWSVILALPGNFLYYYYCSQVTCTSESSPGPAVIFFSCSTQLSIKFLLLINMKMPTIVAIFIFISREIFMFSYVSQERICSC